MRRIPLAAVLILACSTPLAAQHPLAGTWIGGYQTGRNYVFMRLQFSPSGDSVTGTVQVPLQLRRQEPITDLRWSGGEATFFFRDRDGLHRVAVRRDDDVLTGRVHVAGSSLPIAFLQNRSVPEARRQAQYGLYRLSDGSFVSVTAGGELGFNDVIDYQTGAFRSLFPANDSTFTMGPSWFAPLPRVATMTFDTATQSLTLRDDQGVRRGRKVQGLRREEVRFQNGDVSLAGRLILPPGPGPFPAVVFVHGSGPGTRGGMFGLSEYLATQGFATLAYDKRGVGQSTGTWNRNVDSLEFERLAGDALAAVAFARNRPEIDPRRVGFWGISQAGWIIALAARSPDVAFSLVVSGPAVSLGEENYYSSLTGDDGDGMRRLGDTVIAQRMRAFGVRGFDPRPFLRQIASPSLWIFGDRDPSIPVAASIAVLDSVRDHHQRPIAIQRYPNGNHLMLDTQVGNRDEFPLINGFIPDYFAFMTGWLKRQTARAL